MADRTWKGGAASGAQIATVTVGGTLSGETFTISVSGSAIASHTDLTANISEARDALVSAWNSSTNPLATNITAAAGTGSGELMLTADISGIPFTISLNTPGGSATFSQSETAENYGPNDWNTAENWEENVVPAAGDDVLIQGSYAILYGLDQASVALGDLRVHNFSGILGWPGNPLSIDPDSFVFESTGVAYVDLNAAAIAPVVTGTAAGGNGYGLCLTGSAMTTVNVTKGKVGIAMRPGETAALTTLIQGYQTDSTFDSEVVIGSGVTLTNLKKSGGSCVMHCAASLVQNDAGEVRTQGSGAITTFEVGGGTAIPNSSGTISTLTMKGGEVDFRRSNVARTVTNATLYGDATLKADPATVTFTNKVSLGEALQITGVAI